MHHPAVGPETGAGAGRAVWGEGPSTGLSPHSLPPRTPSAQSAEAQPSVSKGETHERRTPQRRPGTGRLADALRLVHPSLQPSADAKATLEPLLITPNQLRGWLEMHCAPYAGQIRVTGTLDRRLVLVERPDGRWVVADLSGRPHDTRAWPTWARDHLCLDSPRERLSVADIGPEAVERLSRPRVLLAALYHPEHFPLPRFPLGVSDVARAARASLMGEVSLADMQLGVTLPDLIQRVTDDTPDILGISATFGQHDLMKPNSWMRHMPRRHGHSLSPGAASPLVTRACCWAATRIY